MDANYPAARTEPAEGDGREHVYNVGAPQSPLFCCSLCLPLGVAGLRVVFVVVDVNDIFISDGYTRLIMGISYRVDIFHNSLMQKSLFLSFRCHEFCIFV